ncbi:hypothetical protein ABB37_09147 [Leptomonas pyrrhocoris]|uniref:Uncharacterized protein n=1 Tax=Leptomonas pyrrhocoris TaxID=157538 RepID=A0A0N0VD24_LEPPY|nr:hypothetical protein ABB37_09147 [Leptomonas pyrrhocoris]XP_015652908.1 hypothetical protein ABB37_09147 [Leptomonas pyrrhocoris]XP_015652909.1 hypothetical protein ABB37_09147 [Leptomonas pyrrhocoris]XP_015652910.1 hypothetical protein ABB37_09147 [Leptomonas pyrrhocoris]KPA74468.1 hypothetical protein ABB37_09147 [Leptomonas pyrrhocoris]KPA74469.1 hypothetical protein ABB37_09147 [Leptomonas pyrrhocoris]KPA74470.1 hypothetical protein ABB37_09147 [Leptomonas pyrrhocoris]KPA74471.1 hypot|eukprot:XP_015652907.1 hypothetical protein ABB37_09147 [Leptomonas pyrrhocoris]
MIVRRRSRRTTPAWSASSPWTPRRSRTATTSTSTSCTASTCASTRSCGPRSNNHDNKEGSQRGVIRCGICCLCRCVHSMVLTLVRCTVLRCNEEKEKGERIKRSAVCAASLDSFAVVRFSSRQRGVHQGCGEQCMA